jgi:hypothetical protein
MSIITELQSLAISSDSDVLSLLRKAYLVARKLGLEDFQEWTHKELNGYEDKKDIPEYRRIRGSLKAWNPNYGWVPVVVMEDELEKSISIVVVSNPIPSLVALKDEENISYNISAKYTALLSKLYDFETNYSVQLSTNSIINIIELVKNKILDWAIILEENGIMGDNLSFSQEEKTKARNSPQIINYVTNIYGSVSDTQFQQGTDNSSQQK